LRFSLNEVRFQIMKPKIAEAVALVALHMLTCAAAALIVALAFLLSGCGGAPTEAPDPEAPRLAAGQYYVWAKVTATRGECGWVSKDVGGYVSVDERGDLHSGVDFITCVTHYGPFVSTCEGLGQRIDLSGEVWDRSGLRGGAGTGFAVGNVGGCTLVRFDWLARRYDMETR
jgi:hypothetical protein